jgi:MYXO-CTERM domain-containing protein
VKYTWYGDLNLDGKVDSQDFALSVLGYNGKQDFQLGQPGWFYGDVNLSGIVDSFDFALMDAGFAAYTNAGGPSAALPEPTSLLLGAFGFAALCGLQRRRAVKS